MTTIPAGPGVVALGEPATIDATDATEPTRAPSVLPTVAFALGIAGVVLGVTVLWYFAAVPIGLGALGTGIVAVRRSGAADTRMRGRATTGAVLGAVAVILGVSAAIFLPRVVDRVDTFFSTLEGDVNDNVTFATDSVRRDVDRIDRSVARDLRRLERANQSDVTELSDRSDGELRRLEARLEEVERRLTADERADLSRLEDAIRHDLRALEDALRAADTRLTTVTTDLEARLHRLETRIGG